MIKKKYNETRMEIVTLYPQLKEQADPICFDRFLDNLYVDGLPMNLNNANIMHCLALFKIECWEVADHFANDTKFFVFDE